MPAEIIGDPGSFWIAAEGDESVRIAVVDGIIELGGRTDRAVLGDALMDLLKNHTHPVAGGIASQSPGLATCETALSDIVLLG